MARLWSVSCLRHHADLLLILAGLGLRSIIANPEVLHALNPMWAVHFFLEYKGFFYCIRGSGVVDYGGRGAVC